jgi:membrane protease YdiL (CAAX protease family)
MILTGAFVAPFMEGAGFRGYFQVALEREFRGAVAVTVSSLMFAFAHFASRSRVAQAFGVLSGGCRVWLDRVSHQLYASGHSAPYDR